MTILPQLEHDLYEAAEARLGGEEPRRVGVRPTLGRVLVAFGVVVALAVAGVGVAVLGAHRGTSTRSAAAPAPGLRQLLARYGVLRRPQTAADRAWTLVWRGPGAPPVQIIPRLTRLAATLPGGQRVFLTVGHVVRRELGLSAGAYMMKAWTARTNRTFITRRTSYTAGSSVLAGDNGVPRSSPFPTLYIAGPHSARSFSLVSIVPDGVRVVGWLFTGHSMLVGVEGNVAAAPFREPTLEPQKVYWHDAHGRIFKTYTYVPPPSPALFGNGVAAVRFGARISRAVSLLTDQLGPPSRPFSARGACGVDGSAAWGDLTAFFSHGRFVGYSYGSQGGPLPSAPKLAAGGVLTLGQTIAQARHLYGRAFHTSEEQGGTWSVRTPTGVIDGFLSSSSGRIGPQSWITTIQAGPFICAALSP